MQFSGGGDSGKAVVKTVESSSGELIRHIPSEEVLGIARNLEQTWGGVITERRGLSGLQFAVA